jgi:uracil-DNA glycosylase family protein
MDKPYLLEDEGSAANSLRELKSEAEHCTRCDLYKNATQTVFGEGSRDAETVIVGEQPGDKEDLAGRPFVGPAGMVLDRSLVEAGIERDRCYVTNTVKHFKFEQRGKRRLHSKPNAGEIRICSWWLRSELELIKPKIVVALGATAANCLIGNAVRITKDRRRIFHPEGLPPVLVTIHPSYILRIRDRDQADFETREFIRDLAEIRKFLSVH